jgi:hypothetical protein
MVAKILLKTIHRFIKRIPFITDEHGDANVSSFYMGDIDPIGGDRNDSYDRQEDDFKC